MFNSLLHQHDRINALQTLLNEIKTKGTISMESADLIERLVPGEISQQDSDFMFDLDESEEGLPIAMEAGLAGLSKLKIAFIVAIIAFIGRYILSLNNNSYSFSAGGGGGGGGGWGGSAPPTFSTNKSPTDKGNFDDQSDYLDLIDKDIKTLHEEYQTVYAGFNDSILKNQQLKSMKQNSNVIKLLNNIIPTIIKGNSIGSKAGEREGFSLFSSEAENQTLASDQWSSFINITDKSKVTDEQIKQLPAILKIINDHYTVKDVFGTFSVENENGLYTQGLGIPFFVIHEETRERTKSFIKVILEMIDNTDNFETALKQFGEVLGKEESGKIDLNEGHNYSGKLWQWLTDNLGKDSGTQTPIKKFIIDTTPIIDLEANQKLETTDTSYLNTVTRASALKKFVNLSINGLGVGGDKDRFGMIGINIQTLKPVSKEMFLAFTPLNHEKLGSMLDGVLEPLEDIRKSLENNSSNIKDFNQQCEDLEKIIYNVIVYMQGRAKEDKKNFTNALHGKQEINLSEMPDNIKDNDPKVMDESRKNLPHMLNLVSSLIQMLLLTLAAAAKYNIELNKMVHNRCKLVIEKCQHIAHDHAVLIKTMNAIMKDSQGLR